MTPTTTVIGVGNAMRGDDGAGPAVVERLRDCVPPSVRLLVLDGEPARLLEAWAGAEAAVVVDAVRSTDPPGTVRCFVDPSVDVLPAGPGGTHGAGIGEAVGLAAALGRLPPRLVVVGIVGSCFDEGREISPAVRAGLDRAVEAVLELVDGRAVA